MSKTRCTLITLFMLCATAFAQGPVRYFDTLEQLLQANPYVSATAGAAVYEVGRASTNQSWGRSRVAIWTSSTNAVPNGTNVFASPFGGRWIFYDRDAPIQDARWYGLTNRWGIDHTGNLLLGNTNVAQDLAELRALSSAHPIGMVTNTASLAARVSSGPEPVLVLDGGTFADSTGNATLFVRDPASSAATNQTDTLAALPTGRWIAKRMSAEPTPFLHADDRISSWFNAQAFRITSAVSTAEGIVTNATIRWPDGSAGVFTVVAFDAAWSTPAAWEYTHAISGKTFTQAAITRHPVSGVVTHVPSIAVAPPGDVFVYPYTNYIGGIGYYGNLNQFRAATNNFTVVMIGADTNGISGLWVRGLGAGSDDGANWWSDAAGIQIKRVQ